MMKMKMLDLSLGLFFGLFLLAGSSAYAEDTPDKKRKEKNDAKETEFLIEGKIEKRDNIYYLITTNEELKLPESKEKDPKILMEDFVNKPVLITAKGFTFNHDSSGKVTVDKHKIEKIIKIQIVIKDEIKKD